MRPFRRRAWRSAAGFTMFEALVAIALMGLVLGALASVTGEWLPPWNRGLVQTQRNEQVTIALDRLAADLSAAEFVTADRTGSAVLFRGDEEAVTFVRSALGPNNHVGLEIVRIAGMSDRNGWALVRTRAPFVLLPTGNPLVDPIPFADPVVLLRAPLRITFAYDGPSGGWVANWPSRAGLPVAVRFDVRDGQRGIVLSTAVRIHAEMAMPQPDQADNTRSSETPTQPNNNAREAR